MSGITVGVDGSGNAQPALHWAMNEAVVRKVPLTVVTVHEVITSSFVPGRPVVFPGDEELLAKARQATEEAVAEAAKRLDAEPQVTVTAVNGFAAQTLIEASREADLLVVGTRGGGGFPRLSLGGVASQVMHHAHCPVVVVRHAG